MGREIIRDKGSVQSVSDFLNIDNCNTVIIAVPHRDYSNMSESDFVKMLAEEKNIIADIKGKLCDYHFLPNMRYWTL